MYKLSIGLHKMLVLKSLLFYHNFGGLQKGDLDPFLILPWKSCNCYKIGTEVFSKLSSKFCGI